METHARFVPIGLFAAAVIGAGFFFVYWIQNSGGLADRVAYRIRFEGSVPGLRTGGPVLFNGIRIGNIAALSLDPMHPGEVVATIRVDRQTPVRPDTKAGIDRQGLLGEASISLRGGTGEQSLSAGSAGEPPELRADPASSQDIMGAARDTIQQIGKVVNDNADPLHAALSNISQFSDALARNSGRVDTILAGLEKLTGGGAKRAPKVHDLTAPVGITLPKIPTSQLVVADPVVSAALDTQRILPASDEGANASDEGQWADSVPKLVQSKIVQAFENANYLRVGRPSDNLTADYQLLLEIRSFRVSTIGEPTATIAFTAKLVGNGGAIADARIFEATAAVREPGSAGAAAAIDEAFGKVAVDLVTWACGLM
jgi:phospholipid/cholesterol/gamma-HCH transport system substrate-binding protein